MEREEDFRCYYYLPRACLKASLVNFKLNLTQTKTLKLANDISPINALRIFFSGKLLQFYREFPKGNKNSIVLSPAYTDKIQYRTAGPSITVNTLLL